MKWKFKFILINQIIAFLIFLYTALFDVSSFYQIFGVTLLFLSVSVSIGYYLGNKSNFKPTIAKYKIFFGLFFITIIVSLLLFYYANSQFAFYSSCIISFIFGIVSLVSILRNGKMRRNDIS